jgi:CBS domain containing-hemolysin-like protein
MIVADHISPTLTIEETSSRKKCIQAMFDNLCYELPVMRAGKLYGTVQLDECIHSQEDTIITLVEPGFASVYNNSHLLDVLRIFNESKANVCCVLGEHLEWVGIITKTIVLEALAKSLTVEQSGAVIIVEMASHQYSSSEIARIIEGEGSQLLGLWLTNLAESGRIRASLKLNTQNPERIINGLQRYGYETVAAFGDDDYTENVERRFQSLMKYIDQ